MATMFPGVAGSTGPPGFGGITVLSAPATAIPWAGMPLAETEFLGVPRRLGAYLANATQWRLVVEVGGVAGAAAAVLRGKYATTVGGGATTLGNTGDVSIAASGGMKGAWTNLPAGAIGDVWLAVAGLGGNGIVSPTFLYVAFEFR